MKPNKSIQLKLAAILREIGNTACIEKAKMLENNSFQNSGFHLRSLGLNSTNIMPIVKVLKQGDDSITSISLSYNQLIGDSGVIALAKHLPRSICEIGLVDCGISDVGGKELLNQIQDLSNLKMLCMEGNNFSDQLKAELESFSNKNPQILVVV